MGSTASLPIGKRFPAMALCQGVVVPVARGLVPPPPLCVARRRAREQDAIDARRSFSLAWHGEGTDNIGMARRKPAAASWAGCKAASKDWPQPGLISLLHELYHASEENRRFLHARLLPQATGQTLTEAERALQRLLSVSAAFNGRFRHADAKRVVDQFEKATDGPTVVADLLLVDLEMSYNTFSEIGDYEPMVNHIHSTMNRLEEPFALLPPGLLASRASRLNRLAERWDGQFGYGISDELVALAADWNERAAKGEAPEEAS